MKTEVSNQVVDLIISDRRKIVLVINDIFPALIFFLTGREMLEKGGNSLFAYTNFLLAILLVIAGIRELRSLTRKIEGKINWLDLVSGIAMTYNTYELYNPAKGFQPAYFYAVIGVLLILKGLSILKVKSFWKLKIFEHGFKIRTGFFSKSKFQWDEIESISLNKKKIIVITIQGQSTIPLNKFKNVDEIFNCISDSFNNVKTLK